MAGNDDLVGVTSYVPPDAMARNAAAFAHYSSGPVIDRPRRSAPPPFDGRPMGAEDAPLPEPLPELVDVAEAPAPAVTEAPSAPAALADTLSVVRASLAAAVAALDALSPVSDLPPLGPDDWTG